MTFSDAFANIIGQTVRVAGPVQNGAILARKVEVNMAGNWEDVKFAVHGYQPAEPGRPRTPFDEARTS